MPFTTGQFLDVFAAYNEALWPFALVLWATTVVVFGFFVFGRNRSIAVARILLVGHWLWSALLYHAFFFTSINSAAWLFAVVFLVQAALLLAARRLDDAEGARPGSIRHATATLLISYGLLYPAVAWADGFVYPRMPTFGVPCPTTVLTIGFLLAVSSRSILLSAIPIAWSAVGISAVLVFGVHADAVLAIAGALLAGDLIIKRSGVMKTVSYVSMLALLVTAIVAVPARPASAQQQPHDHAQPADEKGAMGKGEMMKKMMDSKTTARIDALMVQIKNATGEARATAMAEVIALLVEERAAMGERCAAMMAAMKK